MKACPERVDERRSNGSNIRRVGIFACHSGVLREQTLTYIQKYLKRIPKHFGSIWIVFVIIFANWLGRLRILCDN
jgi:hypothetical protein